MDAKTLASELLRQLRGRRTQAAFSRRLGYSTNVVHTWENGRGYPTAAKFFRLARRVGVDPAVALKGFYRQPPALLAEVDLATPEGVRQLLVDLRGQASYRDIAEQVARDRFAVARWFKGKAEPRLPEFLQLVDACTLRLPDFVACFVDPGELASLEGQWSALQAARKAAYEQPWSHAILRLLELAEYRRLKKHDSGWCASRLHITQTQERECLELLEQTRQIAWNGTHWQVQQVTTVDTRRDGDSARDFAAFWTRRGAERIEQSAKGNFAYNLFCVSEADMERLRALQRSYFAELRAIVAESSPGEVVGVANMHLFPLTER